ncbi:MAG: MBL fold metallo-hydrolase [Eubacteriales bacterium]
MRFCTLSSCSYANSVVVQDGDTCILIDCGLRKRDIKPFLDGAGLSPGDIDAVLVTHCHTDHVYGLRFFLKEKETPLYSTAGVLRQLTSIYSFEPCQQFTIMPASAPEKIGSLKVIPFRLSHDVETIGFIIESGGERMGFITDTGFVPEYCLSAFRDLDYIYIESNHAVEMYRNSSKPRYVIKRNLGPAGHLSNDQCARALQSMGLENCRLVVLGHLSEDDNEPDRALNNARRQLTRGVALASAPARVPGNWSGRLIKQHRKDLL